MRPRLYDQDRDRPYRRRRWWRVALALASGSTAWALADFFARK